MGCQGTYGFPHLDTSGSEIRRRGHWKRGICVKLSEIDRESANRALVIVL